MPALEWEGPCLFLRMTEAIFIYLVTKRRARPEGKPPAILQSPPCMTRRETGFRRSGFRRMFTPPCSANALFPQILVEENLDEFHLLALIEAMFQHPVRLCDGRGLEADLHAGIQLHDGLLELLFRLADVLL